MIGDLENHVIGVAHRLEQALTNMAPEVWEALVLARFINGLSLVIGLAVVLLATGLAGFYCGKQYGTDKAEEWLVSSIVAWVLFALMVVVLIFHLPTILLSLIDPQAAAIVQLVNRTL